MLKMTVEYLTLGSNHLCWNVFELMDSDFISHDNCLESDEVDGRDESFETVNNPGLVANGDTTCTQGNELKGLIDF